MAPLAKSLALASLLAAPAMAAVTSRPQLEVRQYQDPNSPLVINEPSCDFHQCIIYWVPGSQVAVNWINPTQGTVQVDLMTNNNSDVAYNVGTYPATSNTCDAGAGYGQPGPNGAQCGGFVFSVPSSWNAGNYSALRAMSVQDQNLQSYTDKIYITQNDTTSKNAPFSIVSGSSAGTASATSGSSTAAPASTTGSSSAGPTGSSSRGSASMTASSTSGRTSSTGTPATNAALSNNAGTLAFTLTSAFANKLSHCSNALLGPAHPPFLDGPHCHCSSPRAAAFGSSHTVPLGHTAPAPLASTTEGIVTSPLASTSLVPALAARHIDKLSMAARSETEQQDAGPDPILLSLFANRFMSVAESMGKSLQQTSISTNIKERLDFSCALFSPDGSLVANAPHLPVHLGSMSFAVKFQVDYLASIGEKMKRGDVIMANMPVAGGSHLPDITCITPCHAADSDEIIFFCASRGHHADIGGITAGSMPPTSKTLFEEGARIKSFKIVSEGNFDRKGLERYMLEEPAQYPGCSGTRCFRDVESDLQAQIAANQKGINLIHSLVAEWGLDMVQRYMEYIRTNAEMAVRSLLKDVAKRMGTNRLHALEHMDDGTPIELNVDINAEEGSAVFDFEGTGPEVAANFNCPRSVVSSAIIYCLRSMVSSEIPLNQGCLTPIDIRIPKGSLLDPSETAAVVGGNVLTSQRITDVVLKAFNAAAASQGDTNNLTFGLGGKDKEGNHVEGFGYYETIAGGSGAGPYWHGTSGVHTHMTNTRITDPEIMERRYPVVLREFSLRDGSGGEGRFRGGDGVVRDIEFLSPGIQVSILSERRVFAPYGLEGGESAKKGLNVWVKQRRQADGDVREGEEEGEAPARVINLGGKNTTPMGRGDRIIINTPGGGGWGRRDAEQQDGEERTPINERNASGRMAPLLNDDKSPSGVIAASQVKEDARDVHSVRAPHHTTRTKGSVAEWSAIQLGA
ncbi:cytoplasmic protein [Moesziomyces antarcticus]|nr:cytoplasmic protein [Moesziomyces antarcticus]GAK62599.1 cytoplasmic protein [Moesziomyces antarcticus]